MIADNHIGEIRRREAGFFPSERTKKIAESLLIPLGAIAAALFIFMIFLALKGADPLTYFKLVWRGAFGTMFSLENTLQRASPLILAALCVAIPAQLGLVIIGGEGAIVLGGLAAAVTGLVLEGLPGAVVIVAMAVSAASAGGLLIGVSGYLKAWRGLNETIVSLLLVYIAIALFNALVEGPMRDPASLNKPSTGELDAAYRLGHLPGFDVHPGIVIGAVLAGVAWLVIFRTPLGFASRVVGGNGIAAGFQGIPVKRLILMACLAGGACAGLAGMIEVSAVHGRANDSLAAGYGYTGILIAFLARQNPIAIVPMALLLAGISAANGLIQRHMGLPDATAAVLQGFIFLSILASEAVYGRLPWFAAKGSS
ncbi:ABC transporter permease [Celeribacter sp.]|uniref:ABC transporter permease n=1 Tax=Celeribacter sp. TaxID=1890673 RepID=UPI003A9064A3